MQNFCLKILTLDYVFDFVTKTVNRLRGRSLNYRQFNQMFEDIDYCLPTFHVKQKSTEQNCTVMSQSFEKTLLIVKRKLCF